MLREGTRDRGRTRGGLLFRWCAYCQHFLGEKPPFEDFRVTHGLCEACRTDRRRTSSDAIAALRPIAEFFAEVMGSAGSAERPAPAALVARGRALQLRTIDLLVGVLQPALYEVGRRWERGELSPEREAAFTSYCAEVLDELGADEILTRPSTRPLLLMFNAHFNRHTLGLKIAAVVLRCDGVRVEIVDPPPALGEVRGLVAERRPAAVGVSVATAWQMSFVEAMLAALPHPRPRIIVGGAAVRAGATLPPGVEAWEAGLVETLR